MVDETEFTIMEADEFRSEKFECDECDKESSVKWSGEIDDEALALLENDGWRYSEGVLFCKECADECKAI